MALSLQECIEKIKEIHPDLYPVWWIEYKGQYLFNLLKRGVSKEEASVNFYVIDPESGQVSGSIPPFSVYDNPALDDLLDHPHLIDAEGQKKLVHNEPVQSQYYGVLKISNSLSHHGIKGQKWGVRRYQNTDGSLTSEGKERYGEGTHPIRKKRSERIQDRRAETGQKILDDAEKPALNIDRGVTKKGGLTDSAKMNIAYSVMSPVNVVFLAEDGIKAGVASHKEKKYLKERKKNSQLDPDTGLYLKKDGQYNEKQDLAAVNPRYMDMNENSKNNCMLCTTTYDLRKRGYDVTAQKDSVGYTFSDLKRWYPDAKLEKNSRYDENGRSLKQKEYVQKSIKNLLKQGDGAHGNMMMFFNYGGGHSIFYEVKNGQVVFKDGQTNTVYKNPERLLNRTLVNSYARLDNVQPDLKRIKAECVR